MALSEHERTKEHDTKPVPAILRDWIHASILSRDGSTGAKNFLRVGKG
jgi:hypothetical protein